MNSYILWDKNAELFSWGSFTLRWDGLLLLLAFIVVAVALITDGERIDIVSVKAVSEMASFTVTLYLPDGTMNILDD